MTHPDPDHIPLSDALVDDDLRALVAQAAALPPLRPSRDLWPDIAARLDALPGERPSAHQMPTHPAPASAEPAGARVLAFRAPEGARTRPHWLAAAAVALVTVSSGATYLAMRRTSAPAVVARVAEPARARGVERPSTVAPDAVPETVPARVADAQTTPPERTDSYASYAESRVRPAVRSVARSVDQSVPGAAAYDREIADLRAVVAERHGELDSATVDVLTRNLHIIDEAIAASRAALARDPHSPFLGEQLTRALGQKVDLLRTAALLPRT